MREITLNRPTSTAQQMRRLTQILFVSGAFNVLLFLAFLSLLYLESPLLPFPAHIKEHTPRKQPIQRIVLPDLAATGVVETLPVPKQVEPAVAPVSTTPKVEPKVVVPIKKITKSPYSAYVVASGDSLWKIGRKYGVDVATLKQINHLENDRLKQGMVLSIPH